MTEELSKLIEEINNSPFFTMDKSDTESYESEILKLKDKLYMYCFKVKVKVSANKTYSWNDEGFENSVDLINSCLKTYSKDNESGASFITYFYNALVNMCKTFVSSKELENARQGIKTSKESRKKYTDIFKFAEYEGIDINSVSGREKIAKALDMDIKELEEVLNQFRSDSVSLDAPIDSEDEDAGGLDISDNQDITLRIESLETFKETMDVIQKVFNTKQDRVKPILKCLITNLVCDIICDFEVSTIGVLVKNYSFLDVAVLNYCRKHLRAPGQDLIAKKFGKDKTNVSHTINNFMSEVRENF